MLSNILSTDFLCNSQDLQFAILLQSVQNITSTVLRHVGVNSFYFLRLFSGNLSVFMRSDHYRPTLTWTHSSPNTFFGQPYYSEIFVSLIKKFIVKYRVFWFWFFFYLWRRYERTMLLQYVLFSNFSILLSFTVHQKQIKSPCSYQDLWLSHCFTRFSTVSITSMQTGCFTETW